MEAYLKNRIQRTQMFPPTAFTSTIRRAADLFLGDTDVDDCVVLQRSSYLEALCVATVDNMSDYKTVKYVQEHHGLSNEELKSPEHILAAAAAVGDRLRVQTTLSTVSPEVESSFFGSALVNAARNGRLDIVSLLLSTSAYSANKRGQTGLIESVTDVYDKHIVSVGRALAAACERGDEILVQVLSSYTCQFTMLNEQSLIDASKLAAYNGYIRLVQYFVQEMPLSNKRRMLSELMFSSCSGGHVKLTEVLLDLGADKNSHRHDGHSCLCMAAERGQFGVVKLIISRGARWSDYPRGDALCLPAMNGHQAIVEFILDSNIRYSGKKTREMALIRAARHGETRMVDFMISRGVDVTQINVGHQALESAAERGFDHTMRLLAQHGVPVHDDDRTGEPMIAALIYGQENVVELLLQLGAKPVDPFKTRFSEEFECDIYPTKPPRLG